MLLGMYRFAWCSWTGELIWLSVPFSNDVVPVDLRDPAPPKKNTIKQNPCPKSV